MRRFKFKKLLPENEELPDTDEDYREIEAAKFFGATADWMRWKAMPGHERGKLMAYFIAHNYREAYFSEKSAEYRTLKDKGFTAKAPGDALLEKYGVPL